MELIEFEELTPERRAELEGEEADPFEVAGITLRFQPKRQHVAMRDDDGVLAASAGMVIVPVQVAEERFSVVGLGGVIVRADLRGRGLARTIVEAAVARAQSLGPPFALLFCRPDRLGLYQRLSFTEVAGDVLVSQPTGYQVMPLRTMWRALRPAVTWPSGPLTLHSLPF